MTDQQFAVILGLFNKLGTDIALNKAFNTVLLEQVAEIRGIEAEVLRQSVVDQRDRYLLKHDEAMKALIYAAYGKEPPPVYIDDFLKGL
ncbi:MAG: hypothetical protein RIE59_27670 [Imperialibacter sp.]